jgi:hypothetical protein
MLRVPPLALLAGAVGAGSLFALWLVGKLLPLDEEGAGGGSSSSPSSPVDPYAPQQTDHPGACDPSAKPGVLMFRQWAIQKWGQAPGTAAHPTPQNIVRGCDKGTSEHEQGRAWDMMTTGLAHGQAVVDALTAPDPATGEPDALARRAGIMYMIWDHRMWRAYPHAGLPSGSWAPYTGGEAASPHTDHIHFSFSKAGADGLTSLYDQLREEQPNA